MSTFHIQLLFHLLKIEDASVLNFIVACVRPTFVSLEEHPINEIDWHKLRNDWNLVISE